MLEALIPRLRQADRSELLARALAGSSECALTLGDYPAAIRLSREAIAVHQGLKSYKGMATGWNQIYNGDYQNAISAYEQAMALDREFKDLEGEVVRLYNLGNVYFEQGRYQDAYRSYRTSIDRIEASAQQPWYRRRRQIAVANMAILYQRLGRYQQALDQYLSLDVPGADIPPSQRAQVLANQGTLYRRLGDPVKALQTYREAVALFARERHPFGEVGALKNIGIALALDLGRMPEALDAFAKASRIAATSAASQLPSLQLYLAEALRQAGSTSEAQVQFRSALESSRKQGSREYAWRALFGLGQLAEHKGQDEEALSLYLEAIRTFESLRSGLDMIVLKREFLADKREVYDATIALLLRRPEPPVEQLFLLMENSRSRILQDSLAGEQKDRSLKTIQDSLAPGSVLLELWNGPAGGAALSVTRSAVHLTKRPPVDITGLRDALQDPKRNDWRPLAARLGASLLADLPALKDTALDNVIIVPDGALALLPFEVLSFAGDPSGLLLQKAPVFYVPSAGVLLRRGWGRQRGWRMPWHNQVAAFADPALHRSGAALVEARSANPDSYARLPHAEQEARFVASASSGKAELHVGSDAQRKSLLAVLDHRFATLHISTHATADYNDPERSRILLAPSSDQESADFLFLREIYSLDLKAFEMIVLSACDTETGKLVRGEGVEGFGRAFITAGAGSAVTTLWRVDDGATAQFMKQFYYYLGSGRSKAAALREAKLKLLHSDSALAHPAYWAAFVLNGDGLSPATRFLSWTELAAATVAVLLLFLLAYRLLVKGRSTRLSPGSGASGQ
jgi:CHAT domain-containing protein/tetratricopeptide (TPR) repeat protein